MTFSSPRRFQLWEYRVSHGSLLIRSPRGPQNDTNIDLTFDGVEYVSCARMLPGLELIKAQPFDVAEVSKMAGAGVSSGRLIVLTSNSQRYYVVASSYRVDENTMDIFDSPFDR